MTKRLSIGLMLLGFMLLSAVDVVSQQPPLSPSSSVRLPCITKEPRLPDGTEVDCDLPAFRHMKNVGGSDGAGLCVGTSNQMMFDWHHVLGYCDLKNGYQSYLRRFPGGSWTDKSSQQIAAYAKDKGIQAPEILHNTNGDIELQVYALKNGYMPSVRILRSPAGRYGGQSIDHMVVLVGARCGPSKAWCLVDNNYPGTWEWFSEDDWKNRTHGKWSMYTLNHPAPPPIPSPNK